MFSFRIRNVSRSTQNTMTQTITHYRKRSENPQINNADINYVSNVKNNRNPIGGWRKTSQCTTDPKCKLTTKVYRDVWSNDNCEGCKGKTTKPLIKSAQQYNDNAKNKVGSDHITVNNQTTYAFNYGTYLKNRRRATYQQKLPTSKPVDKTNKTYGYGGNCSTNGVDNCNRETFVNYRNPNHSSNSSVSSSSRLERLKLETIIGSSKCSDNVTCNGKYVGGKNRFDGTYYRDNANKCITDRALSRVRGNSNKSYIC